MTQVNSVWAPGETRPMCINVECREGSGPLPYLRLTVKAMVHQGAGILGPDTRRVWSITGPAKSAYAMSCANPDVPDKGIIQAKFGTALPWRLTHGIVLKGPLRGVWECLQCGWFIDDANDDVRRASIASAFGMRMGTPRNPQRRRK